MLQAMDERVVTTEGRILRCLERPGDGPVLLFLHGHWWDFPRRVRCPVLLLHVEGSTELTEPEARRLQSETRDLRYVRLRGCGHNFHLESPERAAEEIRRFVSRAAR